MTYEQGLTLAGIASGIVGAWLGAFSYAGLHGAGIKQPWLVLPITFLNASLPMAFIVYSFELL
jgi:hypothetical protein